MVSPGEEPGLPHKTGAPPDAEPCTQIRRIVAQRLESLRRAGLTHLPRSQPIEEGESAATIPEPSERSSTLPPVAESLRSDPTSPVARSSI